MGYTGHKVIPQCLDTIEFLDHNVEIFIQLLYFCYFLLFIHSNRKISVATRLIFVPSALIGCRIRRPTKIDIPVPTTILNPAKTNNGYNVGFPADSAGEIECRDNKKIKPRKHSSVTKIEINTILAK